RVRLAMAGHAQAKTHLGRSRRCNHANDPPRPRSNGSAVPAVVARVPAVAIDGVPPVAGAGAGRRPATAAAAIDGVAVPVDGVAVAVAGTRLRLGRATAAT